MKLPPWPGLSEGCISTLIQPHSHTMSSRSASFAVLFTLATTFFVLQPAEALSPNRPQLFNESSIAIRELYLVPVGNKTWGAGKLNGNAVPPGYSLDLVIHLKPSRCRYNI